MSKSAFEIVKDFDKFITQTEPVDDYELVMWKLLNEAIDCLKLYIELGIIS